MLEQILRISMRAQHAGNLQSKKHLERVPPIQWVPYRLSLSITIWIDLVTSPNSSSFLSLRTQSQLKAYSLRSNYPGWRFLGLHIYRKSSDTLGRVLIWSACHPRHIPSDRSTLYRANLHIDTEANRVRCTCMEQSCSENKISWSTSFPYPQAGNSSFL